MGNDGREIVVTIDPDLEDLVPGYIENRRRDVKILRTSLKAEDFETLKDLGHSMKGSGSGYGFARITELGGALEQAAKGKDIMALASLTETLEAYLEELNFACG